MLLAVAVSTGACAPAPDTPDRDGPDGPGSPTVTFSGALVLFDGPEAVRLDGATGSTRDLFALDGELGWGGFAALSDTGIVLYESLDDGVTSIRMYDPESGEVTALDDIASVHDFDGRRLAYTRPDDTSVYDVLDMRSRDLGTGQTSSTLLSTDGTELAFASSVPTATPEADLGEPQQRLSIRAADGSGDASEVARGWYAYEPAHLATDTLVYVAYPFGGIETGDVVLYDRHSAETSTLASGARILDIDRNAALIAVAIDEGPETGRISIIDVSIPGAVTMTDFESVPSSTLSAATFMSADLTLVAAIGHEDGSVALVRFDRGDGSQHTVTEFASASVAQLLAHPTNPVAFFVLEQSGAMPGETERSVGVCDVDRTAVSTLLEGATDRLLTLVGLVP